MADRNTITENEFNLLSTAIQGLLLKTGLAKDHEENSTLFGLIGTVIVKGKLGVACSPVAGDWYIHHPDGQRVLGIGNAGENQTDTNCPGFHMWIQTETHIIDLMSPMYPEIFPAANSPSPLRRRMLQLPKKDDAKSWEEFQQGAPLMAAPNEELTDALLDKVTNDQRCMDLAGAALHWWPKLIADPKAILALYPDGGECLAIARTGHSAEGVWRGPSEIA